MVEKIPGETLDIIDSSIKDNMAIYRTDRTTYVAFTLNYFDSQHIVMWNITRPIENLEDNYLKIYGKIVRIDGISHRGGPEGYAVYSPEKNNGFLGFEGTEKRDRIRKIEILKDWMKI